MPKVQIYYIFCHESEFVNLTYIGMSQLMWQPARQVSKIC